MDADYFKKLQVISPFAAAATALQTGDLFSDLTGAVTAPVLYSYVWWCLQQAIHDQVDTLYFLARDGHILYEIAKRFCEQYALPIHCGCQLITAWEKLPMICCWYGGQI